MTDLLDQYDGEATIVQDDRRIPAVVEYRVEREKITIEGGDRLHTLDGLVSWSGTFHADGPITHSAATLELPDGRTGSILIDPLPDGTGRFVGNGKAPSR